MIDLIIDIIDHQLDFLFGKSSCPYTAKLVHTWAEGLLLELFEGGMDKVSSDQFYNVLVEIIEMGSHLRKDPALTMLGTNLAP